VANQIKMYRGDSYPILFTLTDSQTKVPINLVDATITMTIDKRRGPLDATTQVFQVEGIIDPDPTTGRVTFTPRSTDTDQPTGLYYYDISITDPRITKRTVAKSTFLISMDISKD